MLLWFSVCSKTFRPSQSSSLPLFEPWPIFVCLWGRIWATAITQHQPGMSCTTAVFTEALGTNQTQVIILCFHFKLTAHKLQINLMWTQNRRSPWQLAGPSSLAVPAGNSSITFHDAIYNVLSLCHFQALFSRREACHALTQAAGFGWKTDTQRYIYVHWCWQSICYVAVCTWGDLQATWGIHEKSGMIYSQQMQWVCDTSPDPQPKCHRWSFEYQVQKSPRRSPSSGNGVTYTHTHGSQKVPAWLTVRNIYRTDILTTINANCFLYGRATRWDNSKANTQC